jgi:hypothetical protein
LEDCYNDAKNGLRKIEDCINLIQDNPNYSLICAVVLLCWYAKYLGAPGQRGFHPANLTFEVLDPAFRCGHGGPGTKNPYENYAFDCCIQCCPDTHVAFSHTLPEAPPPAKYF